jgi:hypothetical protein
MMNKTVITIAYLDILSKKVFKKLSNKTTAWISTSSVLPELLSEDAVLP